MDISENKHALRARELFYMGYNCSQSVAGAWAEEMGSSLETVLKLASGFGGGMGRMREVCGAVSGAVMVIGMLRSSGEAGADEKKRLYELVQKFAARFKEENGAGTIVCRELLGLSRKDPCSPVPEARTAEYYKKRPCPELIALAAALTEEFADEERRDI